MARPVALVVGGLAVFMGLCGLAGVGMELGGYTRAIDEGGAEALLLSTAITAAFAGIAWRLGAPLPTGRALSRRDAVVAVVAIWFGTGVLGGVPFVLGAGVSPADALFESVSGLTTTGGTIFADIEGRLSRPLLLWRSLIQWLGGMGIVVLFVAVFPNVGVGGKHMFRSEVPGPTAEGLVPRITETSLALWRLYTVFTVLLIVVLATIGWFQPDRPGVPRMDLFQAVCHALTTMSTGGFSPQNASIAAFRSPLVEVVLSAFMLLAGVNYGLFYGALLGRTPRVFLRSSEFRVYVVGVATMVLVVGLALLEVHASVGDAFRHALFMVATLVTSTGYVTDDYMAYPAVALGMLLVLMFVGGMSGSTAGGIKVSRVVLLAKSTWAQVRRSVRPSVVQSVRMSGKSVPSAVLTEVAVFFFLFNAALLGGTLLVAASDGVPLPTGFGANLSALSNMGPAPFYEGGDHFADYTDAAKLWFVGAMVLGRLEFFTVLAVLLPDVWRR